MNGDRCPMCGQTARLCERCLAQVGKSQHYCPRCRVEARRISWREYKRRADGQQKIRALAEIRKAVAS